MPNTNNPAQPRSVLRQSRVAREVFTSPGEQQASQVSRLNPQIVQRLVIDTVLETEAGMLERDLDVQSLRGNTALAPAPRCAMATSSRAD